MAEKKLINIVPLEKEGWYLTRQIHNSKGLAAIETKPLSAVKAVEEEPKAEANTAEAKPLSIHVARVQDEDGKWICSKCGKKLGNQKPNYCSDCGGRFVYGEEE